MSENAEQVLSSLPLPSCSQCVLSPSATYAMRISFHACKFLFCLSGDHDRIARRARGHGISQIGTLQLSWACNLAAYLFFGSTELSSILESCVDSPASMVALHRVRIRARFDNGMGMLCLPGAFQKLHPSLPSPFLSRSALHPLVTPLPTKKLRIRDRSIRVNGS